MALLSTSGLLSKLFLKVEVLVLCVDRQTKLDHLLVGVLKDNDSFLVAFIGKDGVIDHGSHFCGRLVRVLLKVNHQVIQCVTQTVQLVRLAVHSVDECLTLEEGSLADCLFTADRFERFGGEIRACVNTCF